MCRSLIFLVELIEIAVAQEVDGVEDIPSTFFKRLEICALTAEDYSACLVLLNRVHQVFLSHKD